MAYKRSINESKTSSPDFKKKSKSNTAVLEMLLSQNRLLKFTESRTIQMVDVMGQKTNQNVWLQHRGRPMLLIFSSGPLESLRSNRNFETMLQTARSAAKFATVAVVGIRPSQQSFGLQYIEDHHGDIARECGVLHPLGGGRIVLDCMVIIDSNQRQRAVIPLGMENKGGIISFDMVLEGLRSLA
jgi:hypothetical protein